MKILSIDVGIKNLALCIIETNTTNNTNSNSNFIIKALKIISIVLINYLWMRIN